MNNKVIALVSLMLMLGDAAAQSVNIRGARSCGEWTQQRNKAGWEALATEAWIAGYLSGLAFQSGKSFLKGTDNPSLFLWIDNYCRTNPLDDVADASNELAAELIRKKRL